MKHLLVVIFLFFVVQESYGQYPIAIGVTSKSLANTSVSTDDHWSLFTNPSLMALNNHSSLGISLINKFGVSDLNSLALASSFKTKQGHFGLGLTHYGIEAFQRQSLHFGFGRRFGDFMFGASGTYVNTSFGAITNVGGVMLNLGIAYEFNDKTMLSFSGLNVQRGALREYPDETLESNYLLGVKHGLSNELNAFVEAEYELELERLIGKMGLKWQLKKELALMFGLATDRDVFSFGGMYDKKKWRAGFALSYHQNLGFSPALSFSYVLDK